MHEVVESLIVCCKPEVLEYTKERVLELRVQEKVIFDAIHRAQTIFEGEDPRLTGRDGGGVCGMAN